MKALLLLDGYSLMKQLKLFLVFVVVYAGISLYSGEFLFLGFSAIFLALMPYYLMQYNESAKTDALFLLMPCSRKTIVQERYLTVLLTMVPTGLLALVTRLVLGQDFAMLTLGEGAVGMLLLAITLPIVYKFGAVKSRLILIFLMAFLGTMGGSAGAILQEGELNLFSMKAFALFSSLAIPIALCALFVSYQVSLKICEKKEF